MCMTTTRCTYLRIIRSTVCVKYCYDINNIVTHYAYNDRVREIQRLTDRQRQPKEWVTDIGIESIRLQ